MIKFSILLTLLPLLAYGQSSKGGGGGNVVVCYDNDEIKSVELLDIYEGKAFGLKYSELSGDFGKDLKHLANKLHHKNKHRRESFSFVVNSIRNRYVPIPSDAELELTNDAFPAFLPRSCKIKQVANYYNDSTIWLDDNLYSRMDYLNQMALAVHESLYAEERVRGVTDSRYARKITAHLLSSSDPFTTEYKLRDFTHTCETYDSGASFYAKRLSTAEANGTNQWLFYFTSLNRHEIYADKTAVVSLIKLPSDEDDSREVQTPPYISTVPLESKINPNETLVTISNEHGLWLTWKGFDPGDRFEYQKVRCHKMLPEGEGYYEW